MEGRSLLLLTVWMVFATSVFPSDAQMNITQTTCGVTKLCVATPTACDPAGNGTCLFMSAAKSTQASSSMTNVTIELSGQSQGYIALGLVNGSEVSSMAFVCGQNSSNNGTFFFSQMQVNNNYTLTPTNKTATEFQGSVNGNLIQCTFSVLFQSTTFSIVLGSGTSLINGPQTFTPSLKTGPVDLTIPASNVTTNATSTPMVSNTTTMTNGSSGGAQIFPPAPNGNQTTNVTTNATSTQMVSNTTTMTNGSSGGAQIFPPAPNGNQTTNVTTNATSTPMVSNTPTMTMTTTKGASGGLHAQAFLLLLSILTWSILQNA